MKQKNIKYNLNKKAFTLIEMVLVVLIVWLLTWILFKTYITMSKISFRVEQQKIVNQELLFVTEALQNLSNRNNIDYSRYWAELVDAEWLTHFLYLSGLDWKVAVFSSGDCVSLNSNPISDQVEHGCQLFLQKDDKNILLTNNNVYMSEVLFKVLPFVSDDMYLQDISLCKSNYLACLHAPGFWFNTKFYNKWHNDTWANNVSIFVEQFFNN